MAVVTDTIADMLTRIRNANQMRYVEVTVPASNVKKKSQEFLKKKDLLMIIKLLVMTLKEQLF